MLSLTTAQRDLLSLLLITDQPLSATALGEQLHLTARQTHYGLREIRGWLDRQQVAIIHTPGVGIRLACTPEQRQRLVAILAAQSRFQIILTPEQRQQLLAIYLLSASEPYTLSQIQQDIAVARATILKDLDAIEGWLHQNQLELVRRQHRGCWVDGPELIKRQILAALLWGDMPFGRSLMQLHYGSGITFILAHDAGLLPIISHVHTIVQRLELANGYTNVAWAEAELKTRFSDESVEALVLALAIQIDRVQTGHVVEWEAATYSWIQGQIVWPVALELAQRIWQHKASAIQKSEAIAFALQLLSSSRDEPWHTDQAIDSALQDLIEYIMQEIADAYAIPDLVSDQLLRDGLSALIGPATVRQRFRLWSPPRVETDIHSEPYAFEWGIVQRIVAKVAQSTSTTLPNDTLNDLILLLRAAIVRKRTERTRHVLVVCPSGMATTQLLVARLRARFPRSGTFEVLPMRSLSPERIAHADLIITTVPLVLPQQTSVDVIHVHPMLRPEDIAALNQWLA